MITDACKTNNSIKHIWQVTREALVLSQTRCYNEMFYDLYILNFVFPCAAVG